MGSIPTSSTQRSRCNRNGFFCFSASVAVGDWIHPGRKFDAGPLYAYVDADDRHHHASLDLLLEYPEPLLVPTLVITEVVSLIGTRLGHEAEIRFLGDLASGDLGVEPVAASDWLRIAELVHQHNDLPLGAVDASVVAAAERLGEQTIATLDRRHFAVVRPNHVEAFVLLPA